MDNYRLSKVHWKLFCQSPMQWSPLTSRNRFKLISSFTSFLPFYLYMFSSDMKYYIFWREIHVLVKNGCIYRDYIVVFIFQVIWSLYPSNGMITLDRILKDYEKKIVLRDCQMQDFEYLSEKKMNEILLISPKIFTSSTVIGLLLRH